MTSSLIPERPLLISPTLAATIGLEEAVMLHVISELQLRYPAIYREQRHWTELDFDILQEALPFWTLADIKRIRYNLQEKGLVQIAAASTRESSFLIAVNQSAHAPAAPARQPAAPPGRTRYAEPKPAASSVFNSGGASGRATCIPRDWQPSEDLFRQCEQHNIPRDFVEQRVKSFVIYWRERQKAQYSWHHTFLKWIVKDWRQEQTNKHVKELETDMSSQWWPSEDAISILEHAGISRFFIEDAIPEFVLYWRERGLVTSTWNTKFIAHVRRQWNKFNLALEHDNTPRLIPENYEPSDACYEVLAMANIDIDFAREQIPEFVLYWRDRKEALPSWNTKFLQHVKYKWAQRLESSSGPGEAFESAIERFTDRSWAE